MSENDNAALIEESETEVEVSVSYDDESVIWEGRPSQWVNFGTFLWWGLFLIGSWLFVVLWGAGLKDDYTTIIVDVVYWVCYDSCLYRY